ncbi:hypothetical protein PWT90_10726 [Aphanocladium album]|nr:hypothetical protein PWT90_10726 [Aphanocladium album]
MSRNGSSERRPLLGGSTGPDHVAIANQPTNATTTTAPPDPDSRPGLPRAQFLRAIFVGLLILVTADTGLGAGDLAINAFYEGSICYMRHPGLLMAVPFGVLADRRGPQLVLKILWIGDVLYLVAQSVVAYYPGAFDVRWVFACAGFVFLGGGGPGLTAMYYAYAGGIATAANRSTIFLYVVAMQFMDSFLTGPVAYMAMNVGPVFTMGLCVTCLMGCFGLTFLLPTVPRLQARQEAEAVAAAAAAADPESESAAKEGKPWYDSVRSAAQESAAAVRTVFGSSFYVGLLLVGLVFSTLGANEQDLRVQYATKRYRWTWAQAGLLNTVRSVVALPMITLILPSVALLLQKRLRLSPVKKDLWIARGSVVAMVAGSVLQGLAPTGAAFVASVGFYELSRGYTPALVSVLAALVAAERESMVYVCVTMMQALGQIIAGPLLGQVLALGFRMGTAWYGLPFVMCGCLQAVSMLFVYVVRVDGAKAN